jgi:UDP-N-acetylmuramoyl-L-alanyl-D-glutamate--2,6-diaminopimelate ligase
VWPLSRRDIERALHVESDEPDAQFTGAAIGSARWEPGDLYVALGVNGRDGHARVAEYLDSGGKLAIVDERWDGARRGCLRVADVMAAYRALAALMRSRVRCPVIAVAGANGKTTTKEMLRAVLGSHVVATEGTENGHYGVPLVLLDRAITTASPPDAIVVEIGIDEVGAMREHAALVRPDFAVITSLGEEHLRGLHDAETAAREELSLLDVDPKPVRITADDAVIGAFDGSAREVEHGGVRVRVPMPGEHHARLAALAIATALAQGRTPTSIEEGFASFTPPPGRARVVRLDRDVVLVDDTFNASPDSMRAAIALAREPAWSSRPKALFLGDMLDLGDASERSHLSLVPPLASLSGAHVRLFGDEMKRVADALTGSSLASIAHAPSSADPTTLLDGVWASLEGALVIVKASRGMRLERISNAIARAYSRPRPLPDRPGFAADFFTLGVTGTNGKTSTSTFASHILTRARGPVVRATTLGYFIGTEQLDYTLDFDGFVAALADAHARGIRVAVLEVTSEALQHGFAKVWPFQVGVFTNLTHDHLDVHTTAEHYLASKAQLFMNLQPGGAAILNACDPASALLREIVPDGVEVFSYGVASRGEPEGECDLFVREFHPGEPVALERSSRLREFPSSIDLRAPSSIFVENALAAALGAFASRVSPKDIAAALAEAEPPRGRFERVADVPRVFVDYAHTPDALARTIAAGREIAPKSRVIVVFGAGGDRDTRKREPMGRAACAADVVFLTSDNPRTEDPAAIAADIARGLVDHSNVIIELDRARAIAMAIAEAKDDDVVLVCGKGHETEQIIGTTRSHFSDHEVAKLSARNRGSS